MKIFYLVFIFLPIIIGKLADDEKVELCESLRCDDSVDEKVCGVRYGEEEVIFKLFDNVCKLLKYGCQVDSSETYGIINMKYCSGKSPAESENIERVNFINNYCPDCTEEESVPVCGIRPEGEGFRIRTFENECQLNKFNCDNELQFNVTDFFICSNDPSVQEAEDAENEIFDEGESLGIPETNLINKLVKTKNLVIVDGSMLDQSSSSINQSIGNFFAATHALNLPIRNIEPTINESTRKMMIRIFGPVKVYKPWVEIPKNISEDIEHAPTLRSCYHKCPKRCPDVYEPVCGMPETIDLEPSIMYKNHCFMDFAQCKFYYENEGYSSFLSATTFLFCMGDVMSGVSRFVPLIRTLQHLGRLKRKGYFRYKMRNMKHFNNMLSVKDPKLMG